MGQSAYIVQSMVSLTLTSINCSKGIISLNLIRPHKDILSLRLSQIGQLSVTDEGVIRLSTGELLKSTLNRNSAFLFLFDLILYVPVNTFQSCLDGSS